MKRIEEYMAYLEQEEREAATRRQYRRDVTDFLQFAQGRELKELSVNIRQAWNRLTGRRASTPSWPLSTAFFLPGAPGASGSASSDPAAGILPPREGAHRAEYLRLIRAARNTPAKLALLLKPSAGQESACLRLRFITRAGH